jgi:hypothetical protein
VEHRNKEINMHDLKGAGFTPAFLGWLFTQKTTVVIGGLVEVTRVIVNPIIPAPYCLVLGEWHWKMKAREEGNEFYLFPGKPKKRPKGFGQQVRITGGDSVDLLLMFAR